MSDFRWHLARPFAAACLCLVASDALAQDSLMERALTLYYENHPDSALVLFRSAVEERPHDAALRGWLAEAALRSGNIGEAARAADDALRIDPCNAHAHVVRASIFMPRFAPAPSQVSDDSAWAHLERAVECDPADGNAWSYVWKYALMRGDSAAESRALRGLVTSGYLTRSQLTHAAWVLRSLPPNAVLITGGDLDTYAPLAVQVSQGLRPDVSVVNATMLTAEWYWRPVLARSHLAYDFATRHSSGSSAAHDILAWLRHQATAGEHGRPVAFALTAHPDTTSADGELQLAGPYWLVVRPGAPKIDSARVHDALSSAEELDWRGEGVSRNDRSPLHRVYERHPALMVARLLMLARGVVPEMSDEARRGEEEWIRRFLRRAELDASTIDHTIEQLHESARHDR